jgi:hypothetical protein
MKTSRDRLEAAWVTVKWRSGTRTQAWDQLWRRIVSAVKDEDRAIDQNIADTVSVPNPSSNEANNAD